MVASTPRPRVEIEYCTQCRWLLRAAWMAQEPLTTFEGDIGEVALMPGVGGVFEVRVNETRLWSRHERGRFPARTSAMPTVERVARAYGRVVSSKQARDRPRRHI